MSTTTPATAVATTSTMGPDVRGFWRVLLAVIVPLPMLFMGFQYILSPIDGGASFEATVAASAANQERLALLEWLPVPFLILLVPATYAVAWVTRRSTPRLTTAGALIALTGLLAGFGILGGTPHPAYVTVRQGLDVATVARLDHAIGQHPITLLGGLLFILAITIGLPLLGIALWRSRLAPGWMGIALTLGGLTHPFMPGHVASGLGLIVTAAGFAGASVALLRMRNEDFDLPPITSRHSSQ